MRLLKIAPTVSLLALMSGWSAGAAAQSEVGTTEIASDAGPTGLDEIVVTAQKRAETLSKIPAAVSVLGQKTLDGIGARNFEDAVGTIPSVAASGIGGSIAIRGLGTSTIGSSSNGTVAVHIDGIFQNSSTRTGDTQFDISRIEVLRGPQGTLYGRNATAGVVNIITNNADPSKFETFGDINYSRWNALTLRGVVNVPVSDTFAVRVMGIYEKSNSWKRKLDGKHPDERDALTVRAAVHAEPSESITWDAKLEHVRDRSLPEVGVPTFFYNAANRTFIRASNPKNLAAIPSAAGVDGASLFGALPSVYRGLSYEDANRFNRDFTEFRSNLKFDFSDEVSLTYLLGYAHDKNPGGYVTSGLQPFQVTSQLPKVDNLWSHELNLNYASDRVTAIFGAYSFQRVGRDTDTLTRLFTPTLSATNFIDYATPLIDVNGGTTEDKATTRAVFGQSTVDVSDNFRVTGGVRYNWDRVSFEPFTQSQCPFGSGISAQQPNVALLPSGLPLCSTLSRAGFAGIFPPGFFYVGRQQPGGAKSFEKFSWKASAEYDLSPDTLVYATVATGYKAGGIGDRVAIADARFFRPETNINYEAGIRSKLFNNTLSLNLTGFWTDYKDLQIQTPNPNVIGQLIAINAGKSRSRGVELEYAWAPTPRDRISGFLAYLDAKYRDFPGQDPLTGEVRNFRGNRLAGAPEFTGRITYAHIFDLGGAGTITPNFQFNYQTKSYVLFINTAPSLVPSYTRSDIIVRYETADKHFSLEGFLNNLENKKILASVFPQAPVSVGYYGRPFSYGLRAGFRF